MLSCLSHHDANSPTRGTPGLWHREKNSHNLAHLARIQLGTQRHTACGTCLTPSTGKVVAAEHRRPTNINMPSQVRTTCHRLIGHIWNRRHAPHNHERTQPHTACWLSHQRRQLVLASPCMLANQFHTSDHCKPDRHTHSAPL
jgi:hypothetical protein